jgi:hypothetical protein
MNRTAAREIVSDTITFWFETMKFTLHYYGPLKAASSGSNRVRDKWHIRHQLHPQLAELWKTHKVLRRLPSDARIPEREGFFQSVVHHSKEPPPPGELAPGWRDLLAPIQVDGKAFLPLVRESMAMVSDLNILFLRPEEPGNLVTQGGDIDNRIKTLLDGLKMPTSDDRIGDHATFDPTHCLLESDSLITALSVRTDRLLEADAGDKHVVRLVIEIFINVVHVMPYNMALIGH